MPEAEQWIVVRNWDRFQHYSDRNPPWIKLYLELAHNTDFLALTPECRALLVGIWVLYGLARGELRANDVASGWRMRCRPAHLKRLSDAGFIEIIASRPLALARSREGLLRNPKERARAPAQENGAARALEREISPAPRCPECDVGGGRHAADCSHATEVLW